MAGPTKATVAQHYIPKFYLKGFTDRDGVLWVFEKFKAPKASRPKAEAQRPDYYTHAESGERDETAESVLKGVESRVAPTILKLANPHYVPTVEGIADLTFFVAIMFARVPSWREFLDKLFGETMKKESMEIARDKEKFMEIYRHLEHGKNAAVDCERFRESILRGDYEIEQKSVGFNLCTMFRSMFGIANLLREFQAEALYAPTGTFFLTSDSPVFTLRQDGPKHAALGVGFGWPNTEVYFPLNKRACLRLKRGITPRGRPIDADHVKRINRVTMAFAAQFLYSNEGYKRIARLFDERGCKIKPGRDAFMPEPPGEQREL